MRPRIVTTLLLISLGLFARTAPAQYGAPIACPENFKPGFDSITEIQSKQHLAVLAGQECAGRGTGQPGYNKAAQYVATELLGLGFEPAPQSPYKSQAGYKSLLQHVPLQQRVPIVEHSDITVPGKIKIQAQGNIGFDSYAQSATIDGTVVFANCPPGRFRFPQSTNFRGRIVIYQADDRSFKYVQRKIEQYGPLATFRIVDRVPQSVSQIITKSSSQEPVRGSIRHAPAVELLRQLGFAVPAPITTPQTFANLIDTPTRVVIHNPTRINTVNVPNVVAWLPGSVSELQHEFIVVGAHLDHLGRGSATTFWGADDNGSGSTALLNIAQALKNNPLKPRRSVLLIWFTAEELGLLGSAYYCAHPQADPANMIAMLNIDMMGRNESSAKETAQENEGSIHLVGSQKGGQALHDIILDANKYVGFRFEYDEESVFNRSDQYNFFKQGVQVAFLFGGFHPDYHAATDRIESINFRKIVSSARLFYLTIFKATDRGRFSVVSDQFGP